MKNLKALRVLSVMNNNLEEVPFSLGFIESLRVLKLAGNPLHEDLRGILDGNDSTPSPLITPLAENGKDALLTIKIKQHLRTEAAALESGGESRFVALSFSGSRIITNNYRSSESPLDTPRPLKRNSSIRFPVVPATSESESASNVRSPASYKPAVPPRSHYRVASGQNSLLQNATLRRPGVTPLVTNNDRNRSNSESILQATKNKRMGIVTRKASDLGTVDEARTNRNSNHYRGYSHASVLRDKHSNGVRKGSGSSSSTPASPLDLERQRGTYNRRLSSVPEQKREPQPARGIIECSRGVLYSLHQVQYQIGGLRQIIKDGPIKGSSFDGRYNDASAQLELLDRELHTYDNRSSPKRSSKKVRVVSRDCISAYHQVAVLLWENMAYLVRNADRRYIRSLLLAIYGGIGEACIAFQCQQKKPKPPKSVSARPPILAIEERNEKIASRSNTPTTERPRIARRLRSDANMSTARYAGHIKSSANPYAAVPLYVNGRSRSNSRTNGFGVSTTSSVANTPRSGESFLIPGTPMTSNSVSSYHSSSQLEPDHDATFEKIYLYFNTSAEEGLLAIPPLTSKFSRSLEMARSTYTTKEIVDLWSRLVSRCRYCQDMCEALRHRLSNIKLNDPEVRDSKEFWKICTGFATSFLNFVEVVKQARNLKIIENEISRILQPVHKSLKLAMKSYSTSPWYWITHQDTPPQHAVNSSLHWQGHSQTNADMNGRVRANGYPNGHHHRTRGDSGSSSSPYITSGPATPMSAALGPAAVATMPSTPATASTFDRSFQGGVFERLETLSNMQQYIPSHRR